MLLQRETTAVAIVTIQPRSLRDKALRPPDMIGEAAGPWQEAPLPLHANCCSKMKSPYNSLARLPAKASRPAHPISPQHPRSRFPVFVGKIPTALMDYSVAGTGECPLSVRNSQGHNARKVITLPIVSLEKNSGREKANDFVQARQDQSRPIRLQSGFKFGGIMSATVASSDMLNEIKEVNLSYLLLAQRLLREDKPMGMFRMGISEQLADVLVNLTLAQTVKLSASNQLLCRFRFDDHAILTSLADKGKPTSVSQAHSAILMAGQPVEQIG
jgi:flagellar transcriptional activator FlhD